MSAAHLSVAFIPLVDAAPLIVASEMGFDREEGLSLNLKRCASWSSVRDMLVFGQVEAAHLLSPLPVAMSLGIGGMASSISALMVLSMNGNVIGVGNALAQRLADQGHDFDFADAEAAGKALVKAADTRLKIGVPFPFSMHAELLYYWLSASGLPAPQGVDVRTVPPPLMAEALAEGEIDAFCVGEPWGSKAVEQDYGSLLIPGCAIWSAAPEKVLAVRTDWAAAEPDLTARLLRAVWKANRWLGSGGMETTAAELLSHRDYLDLPAEMLDRALTGRMMIRPSGDIRVVDRFVQFYEGGTTFPWRSQARWIAHQLAGRLGMERKVAMERAGATFRTDLYRQILGEVGAVLPGASEKIEGGNAEDIAVASDTGRLILGRNQFFDRQIFDPAAID